MAGEIGFACAAGPGIDQTAAREVCGEFLTYLRETHPDKDLSDSSAALPRIAVTVTRASERSVGFEVTWLGADGTATQGVPLQTSFYDRNADETLRRRFYKTFLDQNPLPF